MILRAALLACALLLLGCAAIRHVEPATARTPRSIRAEAVVEFRKGAAAFTGRAMVLAESPGSFLIEVHGPMGQTVALLASDGESLKLRTDDGARDFRWGEKGIPYSFTAAEAVSFLLGSPVDSAHKGARETDDMGRLKRLTREEDGRRLAVTLRDYRKISGADIPFDITIEDGRETILIRYFEVEVDPELASGLFSIPAP